MKVLGEVVEGGQSREKLWRRIILTVLQRFLIVEYIFQYVFIFFAVILFYSE